MTLAGCFSCPWIMVFGGYADDLRTRPSAITSLSKMPRIRVLVIGHGLCPAGASQIAECKRVSRYLSGGTSYKPTSGESRDFICPITDLWPRHNFGLHHLGVIERMLRSQVRAAFCTVGLSRP